MTDNTTITYMVIITISQPAGDGEVSLHLELGPADKLASPDGTVKLLQDCTLAELGRFASALEMEIWEEYLDATLVDLVVDERLRIDFVYDETGDAARPTSELLLDHVVIFPESSSSAEDIKGAESDQEAVEQQIETELVPEPSPDERETAEDAALDDDASVSVGEPSPAEETDEAGAEPVVTVAESEPVHEEREAAADVEIADLEKPLVRPPRRILGRRRPLGHRTPSAVDILINEKAFRDAQAHAISSLDREVAGVLVGPPPEKQPDGRYVVHISDLIIAKHTRMHGASVTYTPESWRYVNDRLIELYPDDTAVIVGWYHTHPGFGIFLSGMDQFIHYNFFTQIWHIALVLDPVARRSGFFSWNRSKEQVQPYEFPWPDWAPNSW